MLSIPRAFAALSVLTLVAAAAACGSDDDPAGPGGAGPSSSSAGGSTSSSASTGGAGGEGGTLECPEDEGVTLALTSLSFGHGTNGQWKKVGVNIDGLASTGSSTDVCAVNSAGLPFTAYPDGDNGIDNSFGRNIVPMILSLRPNWPEEINDSLDTGEFNALMKMYCLPETGDVGGMTTKVFGGTELAEAPAYDGTDEWPVAPELLADTSEPESSTVVFANSSVTGQLFDSGKGQTFIFSLPMVLDGNEISLKLTVHAAQVQMELDEDRKGATKGTISGVLDTEEFVAQVKKIGWLANMCGDGTFDTIITQIRQASDILVDGTQDPAQTCNGISLGVNFEMKEVLIGEVAAPTDPGQACP